MCNDNYYKGAERIREEMKYFFILRLNIYIEFAVFISFGNKFHNLGALFRIDVPHILFV
jgi:hypothetical protein